MSAQSSPVRGYPLAFARVLAVLAATVLLASGASAAPDAADPRLIQAATELQAGKLDQAIGILESAADTGEIHPDTSFSRGVVYLRRALSERAKAGDYGQAAAGFREALLLRPSDREAALALEQTRLAIARRTATQGEQLQDTLELGERALLALSPWVLFWTSVVASCLTALGLVLHRMGRGSARSIGALLAGIFGVVLVISAPPAWLSESAAASLDLGVVIAERAPLLDDAGRAKKGLAPLREGTEVRVLDSRGPLLRLSLAGGSSFVRTEQVRRLRLPR